jgi:trans-AT polyketide synthase/acyltransferase/oxidoreductase domain-containing protein
MGEGLFERYPEITAAADEILGYSVAELCLRDPAGRLHLTQLTQPALYTVNALSYLRRLDGGAPPPDFLAGHSLGEYNALLAAGVFDFATGLRLVQRRGALMSGASGGGMAAVLGCEVETVEEVLRRNGLLGLDVANYNTPNQVVLSGPLDEIARAEDLLVDAGATYIPLKNVSAAFHSRFMEALVPPLREALDGAELRPPKIPVISNVSALPYADGEIKENLLRQMRQPVRWTESVRYLLSRGVDTFEEVGPGEVLTKLVRSIRKRSAPPAAPRTARTRAADRLGAESFRLDYNVRRACGAGALDHGIASRDLVIRMGRAGYLGFFGAGGLDLTTIEENVQAIRRSLGAGEPFGVHLASHPDDPDFEMAVVDLCLRNQVRFLEASGFVAPSAALVHFRLAGPATHKVIARVSRPDVAAAFLEPPSAAVVADLVRTGRISADQAEQARQLPVVDDLCVDADAAPGGAAVLLPALLRQRDEACRRHGSAAPVRIGCMGIGTPEAAAAAFLLGAEFLLTGSVNQCSVEAGTSDAVKDLLQSISVQDTEAAPAGDLFELGAKVQVLKKDVLFPARANRLYELWRRHGSWEEIDAPTRARIEKDYLGRGFAQISDELLRESPGERATAERDPRHRMAMVFRWYCAHATRLALSGAKDQRANYQVPCGPDLGAFNQWVRGTGLESWRDRHVDIIADQILEGAAEVLGRELRRLAATDAAES